MQLTVKEMELLCVFHAESRTATLEAVKSAALGAKGHPRAADLNSLAEKLSQMQEGDNVYLAFDVV
ncbi:MAG: hypothetical protein FWG87_01670 [Defluviitaleaceae bacterium]|nr:hypothetical protein [Defluviitaleaceae bacterium]